MRIDLLERVVYRSDHGAESGIDHGDGNLAGGSDPIRPGDSFDYASHDQHFAHSAYADGEFKPTVHAYGGRNREYRCHIFAVRPRLQRRKLWNHYRCRSLHRARHSPVPQHIIGIGNVSSGSHQVCRGKRDHHPGRSFRIAHIIHSERECDAAVHSHRHGHSN